MPAIICQPSGKTIEAPLGADLLDALRKGGVEIESPCGGKGTCGKCVVRITGGQADSDSLGALSGEEVAQGYALACRTRLREQSLSIEIPEQAGLAGGKFGDTDETYLVRTRIAAQGRRLGSAGDEMAADGGRAAVGRRAFGCRPGHPRDPGSLGPPPRDLSPGDAARRRRRIAGRFRASHRHAHLRTRPIPRGAHRKPATPPPAIMVWRSIWAQPPSPCNSSI